MNKRVKIDKVKAVELKEQGKTYAEIAEELGCSVDWCKKNLKEVVKNKEGKEMLEKYILQSKSKQAITSGQIKKMLLADFAKELESMSDKETEEFLKAKTTAVKRKINEAGGIVRPQWMHPEYSKQSFRRVLDLVDEFDSRLYEMLEELKYDMQEITGEDTPHIDLSVLSTLKMLSQLGVSQFGASKIVNICDNLATVSERLHELNKDTIKVQSKTTKATNAPTSKVRSSDFADLEHTMY